MMMAARHETNSLSQSVRQWEANKSMAPAALSQFQLVWSVATLDIGAHLIRIWIQLQLWTTCDNPLKCKYNFPSE